ncbi:hypothetical protein [Glycomyces buryatensis]|uniref:Uncharacterized protein n=1 Tax=Glycomyces buryatensis TaxID=2570927 RepID=A0A4S8Q9H3_9ACTN|nr:hypothetical protein [Glycomyces buryatensis]THV40880.1 hypothetical protein FAB82_13580 [Glycomyces buryatensis]
MPPSAAPERASSISVVDRGSVAGIRGALYFQAAVALAFAPIAYQVLLGLSALSGSDAADIHGLASGFIAFVVIPTALHLWAAIQVGRSSWGGALLVVSVLATVVQILMLLPYFVLPAVPFIVALIIELVSLANQDTRRRIESGSAPKFAGLPELIVLPLAIAVFAGLMAWNGNVNDATPAMPETPNPTREFDASEGRQRLEEVVDETLPAFQEVDGFEGLGEERRMENASGCEDGAAPGEEWVDLSIEYDLGEFEPDSELSLAYLESIRTRWTEQGYEVTLYVRENDSGVMQNRRLTAVRDDGVAAVYDVGYGSASFVVRTGCVLQPE